MQDLAGQRRDQGEVLLIDCSGEPMWVRRLSQCAWGRGALILLLLSGLPGCRAPLTVRGQNNFLNPAPRAPPGVIPWVPSVPTEKEKSTLPVYVIEPPDILLIDAVKLVPKAPYHIEPLDTLQIVVVGTLLDQPISGQFPVDPAGMIDLGPAYGKVRVGSQTVDE